MKRILVTGLKDPVGGVESAVMGYIRQFDHAELQVDVAVFGEVFSLRTEIEQAGGRVFFLPSRTHNPVAYKKAVSKLFATADYDAVWSHFSGLTNIDILKEAKKAGVPLRIAHAHTSAFAWGNALMRYAVPLMHRKNQKVLCRYATHLWACSETAARFMFGEHPRKEVSIVANAVDVERFVCDDARRRELRAQYGFDHQPIFVHVGRMCAAKNQLFLLDVFKEIHSICADARLLFIGDGELHDAVVGYAEKIGIAKVVRFVGATDGTADVLPVGDVFLLPSKTEGFPVTVVEAQAAGLPCLVSDEAVPRACDLTGLVNFLTLQAPVEVWAQKALSLCGKRENAADCVVKAGYDTKEAAARLQRFFTAKRVGIVTFPRAVNYGTALQAVALQNALQSCGANAYFADHICRTIAQADKPFSIKHMFDLRYTAAHLLNLPTAKKRNRRFAAFADRYMQFGSELPQMADVMVAGSDQIWNEHITGEDTYYFLDFKAPTVKKTAYAASFGVLDIPENRQQKIGELLSDFAYLSVREQAAADLVERVSGRLAEVVPDPTLLLSFKEWERYMAPSTDEKYIFVYTVFNSDSLWEFAEELSQKTGLPIKTISYSVVHKRPADTLYTADPSDWLRCMADAAYVVTNSFHGVAFSINFQKEFFYELPPQQSGVASRVSHIAKHYGLEYRSLQTADTHATIDFSAVQDQLRADRMIAQDALRTILNV